MNVTVSWILSGGDSADFYLINITTNAPETTFGKLLNITTFQYELTGFMTGHEYKITVHGVNCKSQEGDESEPLTITPQGEQTTKWLFYKLIVLIASIVQNEHTTAPTAMVAANLTSYTISVTRF